MIVAAAIEDVVFDVASALRIPVLLLALAALAVVLVELGALAVELLRRRRHDPAALEQAALDAAAALRDGDRAGAATALGRVVSGERMERAIARVLRHADTPGAANPLAKALADYDLESLRRLERTRLLVRAGPALGLMGTLIPLSPALAGLASGNVTQLTDNLRVAFSVTVLGLMVGAIAFGISLVRDRLYAQDLSDLEFLAASVEAPTATTTATAVA
ncbi:MAG TPA: MotA/TolQ/ExbB proton channel family protein [Conexibacter sp.]|nr:MotA/TolQ/ExbB proton channel family protein [Conexibacter sp.]